MKHTEHFDVRAVYDDWHNRLPADRDGDAPWHRLLAAHLDADRDQNGKAVLEIGCGGGGLACRLARQRQRPVSFVAADLSSAAIFKGRACAARDGLSGISWEVADIHALAHPAETFDTVICCETIEHVPSPPRGLAELARVLRRGGRLLVTTPNYFGPFGMYRLYMS